MPEIIVKYKDKRTLEALRDFAKYFDYEIALPESLENEENQINVNGVTILPAVSSVDTTELTDVFTGKDINPIELRQQAWQKRR